MTSAQSGAELLFLWTLASALLFPTRELATVRDGNVQSKGHDDQFRRVELAAIGLIQFRVSCQMSISNVI